MRVTVAMVSMAKGCEAHDIHYKAEGADYQQLVKPMKLVSFPKSLDSIENDLNTD